jgi:hypothetical protein
VNETLIYGPVCRSWYLVFTEEWDPVNDICEHDSCWRIMSDSDGPVGLWFRCAPS